MEREQYMERAATMRRGKTICNVMRDKHGRKYAASIREFGSINLAKREVRRKIRAGFAGCVVLQRGESFPLSEADLPVIEEVTSEQRSPASDGPDKAKAS